jgi:hypothetical protein
MAGADKASSMTTSERRNFAVLLRRPKTSLGGSAFVKRDAALEHSRD